MQDLSCPRHQTDHLASYECRVHLVDVAPLVCVLVHVAKLLAEGDLGDDIEREEADLGGQVDRPKVCIGGEILFLEEMDEAGNVIVDGFLEAFKVAAGVLWITVR